MIKHYKANTAISINVVLNSKKNMHVSFTSQTDGSSIYITDNEDVQNALEHHYKFGKLFKLASQETEAEGNTELETASQEEEVPEIRKVEVSDLASAKDYLADNFGISRTSMRSEKSIIEAAKAHNIEFVGL